MIRLGYACINTLLPSPARTLRLANYTEERMLEITRSNLEALETILVWNSEHDIKVFRITSDLVPFGSSPVNSGSWKRIFQKNFEDIGTFIKKQNMRMSMHPGAFTILNARTENVHRLAVDNLRYHADILDLMRLGNGNHIVIHGGGRYNNKNESLEILKKRVMLLDKDIYRRLALENDERVFDAKDILEVCIDTGVKAVFDVFHHQILAATDLDYRNIILSFNKTWLPEERQEIHYSNQNPKGQKGSHSDTIDIGEFGHFYEQIKDLDLDIMLEVKDKQESVLRLRKSFPNLR